MTLSAAALKTLRTIAAAPNGQMVLYAATPGIDGRCTQTLRRLGLIEIVDDPALHDGNYYPTRITDAGRAAIA